MKFFVVASRFMLGLVSQLLEHFVEIGRSSEGGALEYADESQLRGPTLGKFIEKVREFN